MANLCAISGASAGVWLRQLAWNHVSGVSVWLSPGFLISPWGLSTWLALGSQGSIRDCSKSKSPQMQNTYQTSVHITIATVPLARASRTGRNYTLCECQVWFIGSCQGKCPPPHIHIWKNTSSSNQRPSHCTNPHPRVLPVNPKNFFLLKGK